MSSPTFEQSVSIRARSSWTHEVAITAQHQYVEWSWKLDAYDISFSLTFQPSPIPSSSSPPPPPVTIHSPPTPLTSDHPLSSSSYTHPSSTPGLLLFTFSNLHSSFRTKQLHLSLTSHPSYPLPLGLTLPTPLGPTTILARSPSTSMYTCHLPYATAYLHSSFLLPHTPPTLLSPSSLPPSSTAMNARCMWGVWLFFTNHLQQSEAFFQSSPHPMFSISYACIGFLRALMTWTPDDMQEANHRLTACRDKVAPNMPGHGGGRLAGLGRWVTGGGGGSGMTNEQLEAVLMSAETLILQAILLLLQENVRSFMAAGLKIRSSRQLFDRCWAEVKRRERVVAGQEGAGGGGGGVGKGGGGGEEVEAIDAHVLGGIQNGIGTFNVILSLAPPIILRLLSFLGYSANRAEGMRLLHASAASEGIRAPLSALVLLFLHVVVPSFFTLHLRYHLQESEAIFAKCFARYPNGSFFLWLKGRQQRCDQHLEQAVQCFHRAAAGQPEWRQLQHICAYELGLTYSFLLQFERATPKWEMLEAENQWSKGFYLYMLCVPLMEAEQELEEGDAKEEARERVQAAIARIDAACDRRFGGKQLSLEQFVLQRSGEWKKGRRLVLPSVEVIYHFHGFPCMTQALLQRCMGRVEDELERSPYWSTATCTSNATPSTPSSSSSASELSFANHCLLLLLYSSLLTHLGRSRSALPHLHFITAHSAALTSDSFLTPFAQFELATIHARLLLSSQPNTTHQPHNPMHGEEEGGGGEEVDYTVEDVIAEYRVASGFREPFHFKNRLHLRIHLAVTELKRYGRGEGEGAGREGDGEDRMAGVDDADDTEPLGEDERKLMELAAKAEADADRE